MPQPQIDLLPDGTLIVFGKKVPVIAGVPVSTGRTIKALYSLLYPDEVNDAFQSLEDDRIVIQLPEYEALLTMPLANLNRTLSTAVRCANDYATAKVKDVRPTVVEYDGMEIPIQEYWDTLVRSED